MAKVRLARRAASDLAEIAAYTIARFGIAQARRYRDEFERAFPVCSRVPSVGNARIGWRPGCGTSASVPTSSIIDPTNGES